MIRLLGGCDLFNCPSLDVTVQIFKESPGMYYDHVVETGLYSTKWKVVT